MTSVPQPDATATEPVVAGRYRLEQRLGKGGMGAVFRAHDLVTDRPVALKRLLGDGAGDARQRVRMFEREYHTLAGLRHPRIIQVHDYGLDADGAFYTMELLDGRDLRERAPLPFALACQYLRDVACSLALLHARRLLHRDLSARNVRITADGHAKLLDFGALASFGKSTTVVGTPPGVPPEALYGGELDQRSDLYALGALAYWALTGRHAYDVKALEALPAAWERSLRAPSELARAASNELPTLPPELDELVLSLLSPNPLARPASAVEVIQRLSSIAKLPPETEPLAPASYLQGGKTVGRVRERAQLRKRLKAALAGRGSVVALQAEAGMGSSRLLSELAIEARLLGAVAVVVDARQHRGSYGVAEEIARALLVAQPERARRAMGTHESALLRFLPSHEGRISTHRLQAMVERTGADPRELRLRTQAALQAWVATLVREVPLVLAVRGLEHADEASVTWLTSLARGARDTRAMIVFSVDPQTTPSQSAALAALRSEAFELALLPLSAGEVRELVEATFGEVDNTERLAAWLFQLSGGSPEQCLDLVRYLVDHEVIAFDAGVWVLPLDLAKHELPGNFEQALRARLSRMGPAALRLAQALAVHRGPIPRARLVAIAEREGIGEPLAALDELEQRGVLLGSDTHLRFAHDTAREAVLATLSDPERRRLHAQLGQLLEGEQDDDPMARLDAGFHLLHGGQEGRGADLLAEVGIELCFTGEGLTDAVPALRAALDVYRKQGRSTREHARLLGPLATAGFYLDREVIETFGEPAEAALSNVVGLSLARRLRPYLGRRLGLYLGLGYGFLQSLLAVGPRRAFEDLAELVRLYSTVVQVLVGLGALTLDAARARRYAALLEPLTVLGADHGASFNYAFAQTVAMVPEDHYAEAIDKARAIVARLDDPRPIAFINPAMRRLLNTAALYLLGGLLGVTAKAEALVIAARLEAMDWQLDAMFAHQIRAAYHGTRGEVHLADRSRDEVERIAMLAGSSWQAELWSACNAIQCAALSGDALAVKRIAAQLDRIARSVPSLRRHALLAEAASQMLQGNAATAVESGERALEGAAPRSFVGWASAIGGRVRDQSMLGLQERALAEGLAALELYDAKDRQLAPFLTTLVTYTAVAEAELGDCAAGARRIDEYLAELDGEGGPLVLGTLYEARARIALRAGDLPTARLYGSRTRQAFAPTENPVLIARTERLQRELDAGVLDDDDARATVDLDEPLALHGARALARVGSRKERHERVLALLVAHVGGARAALYACADGALTLCAGKEHDTGISAHVRDELARFLRAEEVTVASSTTDAHSEVETRLRVESAWRTYVLARAGQGGTHAVAVACIEQAGRALREPSSPLLEALAQAIVDAEPEHVETPSRPSFPPVS